MIDRIERLREEGINRFRSVMRDKHRTDSDLEDLLSNYTSKTKRHVEVYPQSFREDFRNRFDFGRFLVSLIPYTAKNERAIYSEIEGIGAWLALRFINVITEIGSERRKFKKVDYRYIPDVHADGGVYRHFVLSPWKIYGKHRGRSKVFLAGPPSQSGIVGHFSIYNDIMESDAFCYALTKYFFDPNKGELKSSWSTKRDGVVKVVSILRSKKNIRLMDGEELYRALISKLGYVSEKISK